ncbi:hypothetical protein GTA51_10570 [Desulfovibrio aerotolerans]|uniref:Uncharacterized protein n=1 Tax=Solidesulfovibrio aerotolerans TaxID=295255 RepID=A0A7C9ISR7_9BACT|nr:hypothetical protein [Solidesulfovibrio aerotolerans]MYL83567.1 hypothetical protein [Solidesulfovibrio aerotolerans]
MNGPAAFPTQTTTSRLPTGRTTRLAYLNEREVTGVGSRFWDLTLHKTATGGYILESVIGPGNRPSRPMAATLAFADAAQLLTFLGAPDALSPLAEGLLERAAGLDPDLGPRRAP